MSARDYHRVWLGLIGLAVVIEGIALARKGYGDTLSEWVWSKISTWPLRALVGALLMWLTWHFLWSGPKRGFTKLDLVAVALGLLVGFAGFRWGWAK